LLCAFPFPFVLAFVCVFVFVHVQQWSLPFPLAQKNIPNCFKNSRQHTKQRLQSYGGKTRKTKRKLQIEFSGRTFSSFAAVMRYPCDMRTCVSLLRCAYPYHFRHKFHFAFIFLLKTNRVGGGGGLCFFGHKSKVKSQRWRAGTEKK